MELKLSKFVMIDLVFYSFCYDLVFNYFLLSNVQQIWLHFFFLVLF